MRADWKHPLPIGLAIIALLGWIAALALATQRADLAGDVTRYAETVGTVEDLEARQAVLTDEVGRLDAARAEAEQAARAATDLRGAVEAEVAGLTEQVQGLQAQAQSLEEQLGPRREELAGFQDRLTETETRLAERSAELSDVGTRLEEARASESGLRETLAGLQQEAATLAEDASLAEQRLQAARTAEEQVTAQVTTVEDRLARLTAERDTAQSEVADLSSQRERLSAGVAEATAQYQEVQRLLATLTEDLSERSARLAEVEQRLAQVAGGPGQGDTQAADSPEEAQTAVAAQDAGQEAPGSQSADRDQAGDSAGDGTATSGATFQPGIYASGDLIARFGDNGSFRMDNVPAGRSLAGTYRIDGGLLLLEELSGDVDADALACRLNAGGETFTLGGARCGPFAGLRFGPDSTQDIDSLTGEDVPPNTAAPAGN